MSKAKQNERLKKINKIKQEIKKEAFKLKVEPDELTRKQFRKIMIKLGYPISYTQANEAFIEAKGIEFENSQTFDFDALVNWIADLSNHRKSDKTLELPKTKNIHMKIEEQIIGNISKDKLRQKSDERKGSKSSLNTSMDSKDLKIK